MYGPTGGGKKFATSFHFTFSAEFLTPLTPDFNVGISKHENIFFLLPGGRSTGKKFATKMRSIVSAVKTAQRLEVSSLDVGIMLLS